LRPSYPDTVDLDPIRRIPWSTSGHVAETVSILTGAAALHRNPNSAKEVRKHHEQRCRY